MSFQSPTSGEKPSASTTLAGHTNTGSSESSSSAATAGRGGNAGQQQQQQQQQQQKSSLSGGQSTKGEAEIAAERLYEERIEEEYAKREGGA
ncbi:MAG: hypothetical protein M1825_003025 [Sarcosagium campestre]|nr:MAG: hypothetical protein M1825_003025 [Sarcosagium campestre]